LRWRAVAVVLAFIGLTSGAWRTHIDQAAADTCTPWAGQPSLQAALDANVCTELQPGIYIVNAYLVIPDGHTLQGNPGYTRNAIATP
jgi:hypothetical protein